MTLKKIFSKDIFFVFLLSIISLLMMSFWFNDGKFIAGGEEALSTWNPTKALSVYNTTWIDLGLANPSPFWLPRLSTYIFTYLLSFVFSPVVVQAILFGILTFIAGGGMYLLADFFINSKNKWIPFIAGTFYVLNLYTQSQVWARFIFAGFFAWASFPILLFLWIKWTEEAKFKFLFFFCLLSVIFSASYSHPAFILGFWSIAILFSLFKISSAKLKLRDKKSYLLRIILGVFGWTLFNLWWIYPYVRLQDSVVSNLHDWKYDLANLGGVSVDSKIGDVLLLRHKFFFERLDYWGDFYKSSFSYLLSLGILGVTLFGFIKSRVLKDYKYLAALALIGLFICKGTNPPFGTALFSFLFEYIPFARAFRSSYEKFGAIWLIVYSILFAYGLGYLYEKVSKFWKVVLLGIFIPLWFVVLVWPMWKNGPFSPLAKVEIPSYYSETDKYLNELGYKGRILSLPIIPGEGAKYNWDNTSYYGLEHSDMLFSNPVISKTVRYKYADEKYMEIYEAFTKKQNINKLLQETDVEYLIFHNEIDSGYSNASSSAEVRETLKKYTSIKLLKSIGKLDVYKNTNYIPNSLITTTDGINYSYRKIGPDRYTVEVKNAEKPFELILKTSFSPLWEARIADEKQDHGVVYNYANGWNVNKRGSYRIDLVFKVWPAIFYLGY